MARFSLSEGALYQICQGSSAVDQPILQLLSTKKIAGTSSERFRLLINDGRNSNSYGMLATQLNGLVHSGDLDEFCVFKCKKQQCNIMQGKKVIIILELEVLQSGKSVGSRIGSPVPINADGTLPAGDDDQNRVPNNKRAMAETHAAPPAKRASPSYGSTSSQVPTSSSDHLAHQTIFPIASLTPYQNKWTIKARVTHKSDIRRWSNSRGEGHLFSMDLVDESGEIRATAFKEQCDKYYNMIEVGKVFYISSCTLKAANKQYTTMNNEYELTFRESTEVAPCNEASAANIPTVTFNFCELSQLTPEHKDQIIDVIGICKSAADPVTITSQRTGKELRKRDLTLVDKSLAEIGLTIWGTTADSFDPTGNPVVAIKGAKVSDFNGVSLSSLSTSTFQVNPDMPQSYALKGWYDMEGSSAAFTSLTQARGAAGGESGGYGSNLKTLGEVKVENVGLNSDRGDYYSAVTTIVMFQKDKALYQACSQSGADGKGCNKKVQDLGNGSYRCEKCNVEMDTYNWRLILSFSMADCTDNQWVTCFQDQAEQILGISAQELGSMQQHDPDAFNKAFQDATFRKMNFRLRGKADSYNDEQRVKHTVMNVSKMNWAEYNKRLIREIEEAGEQVPSRVNKSAYI